MKFSRKALLSVFLLCVDASPVSNALKTVDVRASPVTQTQFDNFHLFAQYSAASYCANNDNNSPGPISCINDVCPLVSAANAITLLEFNNGSIDSADVFGYVATDPTRSLIIAAFRGADSIRNWIANVKIDLVDTPICNSCQVHDGFNTAWAERQPAVVAAIESAQAKNPSYKVVLTGHSLGAAVATIGGAYLRSIGINCDIYTYGSPRVGNDYFANYVSSTSQGSTSRITHLTDPVPHLPPGGTIAWLTDYYHTSPEYWLYDGDATTTNYAISDIKVCTGINTHDCADGVSLLDYNSQAHGYYFEKISGCDPTFTYR